MRDEPRSRNSQVSWTAVPDSGLRNFNLEAKTKSPRRTGQCHNAQVCESCYCTGMESNCIEVCPSIKRKTTNGQRMFGFVSKTKKCLGKDTVSYKERNAAFFRRCQRVDVADAERCCCRCHRKETNSGRATNISAWVMLCRIARAERNHRFCSFWKVIWYYTILYHCDLWIDSIHMYHHISLCLICTCFTDADWLSASTLNSLGLDIAGQWVVNLEYTWRQTAYALLSQRKDCPSSILGLDEIRTPLYIYIYIYLSI